MEEENRVKKFVERDRLRGEKNKRLLLCLQHKFAFFSSSSPFLPCLLPPYAIFVCFHTSCTAAFLKISLLLPQELKEYLKCVTTPLI